MFLARLIRGATRRSDSPSAGNPWWQPFIGAGYIREPGDNDPASAEDALGYHAWFRAVSLIAQKCASVPRHVLRRDGEGKQRAYEHPAYRLVADRANSEQTAFQFWLQMSGHVVSRGNGYAAIWRENGVATELIPLDPDETQPGRIDGALWYLAWPFGHSGDPIKISAADMLHFRGLGFDGIEGYPVWAKAAKEIGLANSQRELQEARNSNDGRVSLILSTDATLDDKTKTRYVEDWKRAHNGVGKSFKMALMDRGLKATPISMSAEELGQDGALQMSLVAISNYTGVPTSKLGASGKSYASQEQEDLAFVSDCLDFYLNLSDDESGAKLLSDDERAAGYEVKSNRESLLRSSIKDKFEALLKATGGKPILTQNEARKKIDMPATSDDGADELGTPLNFGQGGMDNSPDNPNDPGPGRPEEKAAGAIPAARAVIEYTTARLVRRAAAQANRVSDKPAAFLDWLDSFKTKESAAFAAEFAPCERLAAAVAPGVAWKDSPAECLLVGIHSRYAALAENTKAALLPSTVAKEGLDQERCIPQTMSGLMLGEERPNGS